MLSVHVRCVRPRELLVPLCDGKVWDTEGVRASGV